MRIPDVRAHLTKEEMEAVTEKALANGPFQVLNIRRIGSKKEVTVKYQKTGAEEVIVLDPVLG
jgi:hypothetical protein